MDDWDIRTGEGPTSPLSTKSASAGHFEDAPALRSAQRGVLILRITAIAIVVTGLVAELIELRTDDSTFGLTGAPFSYRFTQFLRQLSNSLAFGGLVFAASCIVQVLIVRAAAELGGDQAPPSHADARGDLVVKAPPRARHRPSSATPGAPDDSIWRPREPAP